jgi:hypothetical protein
MPGGVHRGSIVSYPSQNQASIGVGPRGEDLAYGNATTGKVWLQFIHKPDGPRIY